MQSPRRAARILRRGIQITGVGRALNALATRLPPGTQLVYQKLKVRAGFGKSLELVPSATLEEHYRRALALLIDRIGRDAIGDYLEFGVYVGTSMTSMHRALATVGLEDVRLIGFDSFQGLPSAATIEGARRWRPGQFRSDVDLTRMNLRRNGVPLERVTLIPGWFEETATDETAARLGLERASVVLIDGDLYSSAVTALEFCAPRLGPVSVVFLDEWSVGSPGEQGFDERRAFGEFLQRHPEFQAEEVGDLGRYKDHRSVALAAAESDETSRGFVLTRVAASGRTPG